MHTVTDFGAVGDGVIDDTAAVQAAIDACYLDGGGCVVVPSGGTYRCGTLELRSNLDLHLETGATRQASPADAAYTVRRRTGGLADGRPDSDSEPSTMFITAEGCRGVSITGQARSTEAAGSSSRKTSERSMR